MRHIAFAVALAVVLSVGSGASLAADIKTDRCVSERTVAHSNAGLELALRLEGAAAAALSRRWLVFPSGPGAPFDHEAVEVVQIWLLDQARALILLYVAGCQDGWAFLTVPHAREIIRSIMGAET